MLAETRLAPYYDSARQTGAGMGDHVAERCKASGLSKWLCGPGLAALMVGVALPACTQSQPQVSVQKPPARQVDPVAAPTKQVPASGAGLGATPLSLESAVAASTPSIRTVATLSWGSQVGQLGRVLGGEQSPEGPMSLDADAAGQVWVLDQVNERLVRLGRQGQWHQIAAPRTAQELAVDDQGQVWVLDRLVGKQLVRLDGQSGAQLNHVSLEGPGQDPWLITALQVHGGALYAEYEHSELRRLVGSGPTTLQGRPTRDQRWLLKALRIPPDRVAVAGRAPGAAIDAVPGLAIQTQFSMPVAQLVELGAVEPERIWLVADLVQLGVDDQPIARQRQAVVLDSAGQVVQRRDLCVPYGPEEQLRSARLGRDGHLYNLCLGATGVTVQEVLP